MEYPLHQWFDRVYVINCVTRPDRKEQCIEEFRRSGMADPARVVFYPGIVGAWTSCPGDWRAGAGAWGCFRSHQRIMEDVMMERDADGKTVLENVLILEDDVFFVEDADTRLHAFMLELPPDWDQLYLGGQHRADFAATKSDAVIRGMSVNRTHAYALNSKSIPAIYRHISYATDYISDKKHARHIDHQFEHAHRRQAWNVYCPKTWIAGQREGQSNILGNIQPRRLWQK